MAYHSRQCYEADVVAAVAAAAAVAAVASDDDAAAAASGEGDGRKGRLLLVSR